MIRRSYHFKGNAVCIWVWAILNYLYDLVKHILGSAVANERSVHFLKQYCGSMRGCNASSRERIDFWCRLMKSGSTSKTSLNTEVRELIRCIYNVRHLFLCELWRDVYLDHRYVDCKLCNLAITSFLLCLFFGYHETTRLNITGHLNTGCNCYFNST